MSEQAIEQTEQAAAETVAPRKPYMTEVIPDNIIIDPELKKLRDWRGGTTLHELSITMLADTIENEGQMVPALVRPTENGLVLVYGHRRLEAIKYLRNTKKLDIMLRVEVDESLDADTAFRMAVLENFARENFTPIEQAKVFAGVRSRFGYQGPKGTPLVAAFCSVSPATVHQKEKLLTLPPKVQEDVSMGRISESTALELIKQGEKEEQAKTLEKARVVAEAEHTEKAAAEASGEAKLKKEGKEVPKTITDSTKRMREEIAAAKTKREAEAAAAGQPAPVSEGVKVEKRHVQAAATGNEVTKPKLKDLLELTETWCGPVYPTVMRTFSEGLLKYFDGKMGQNADKKLEALWDDLADKVQVNAREQKQLTKAQEQLEEAEKAARAEEREKAKEKAKREKAKLEREAKAEEKKAEAEKKAKAALKAAEKAKEKAEKEAAKAVEKAAKLASKTNGADVQAPATTTVTNAQTQPTHTQ